MKKPLLCETISWRFDEQSLPISLIYFYWEAIQYFNGNLPIYARKMLLAHVQRDFCAQISMENTWRSPFPVPLKRPITLLSSHYRYYEWWLLDVTMPPSLRCSYHGPISMIMFWWRTFDNVQCSATTDMHAWTSLHSIKVKSSMHTAHKYCCVLLHLSSSNTGPRHCYLNLLSHAQLERQNVHLGLKWTKKNNKVCIIFDNSLCVWLPHLFVRHLPKPLL